MKKNEIARERRQSVRFRIFSIVKYAIEPDGDTFQADNIQNVSRGGLSFCTEEEIEEGAILKLYFLPPHCAKPIEAKGKVVRCNKVMKSTKVFEIGIQFLDVSEEGRIAIQELEARSLRNQK